MNITVYCGASIGNDALKTIKSLANIVVYKYI